MEYQDNDYTLSDYFCVSSIVLSLFFDQYNSIIPGITLGELILVLACCIVSIKNSFKIYVRRTRSVVSFFILGIVLTVVSIMISDCEFLAVSSTKIITRWIRYMSYIFGMVVMCDNFYKKDLSMKLYQNVCLVISLYTILQTVLYFGVGYILPTKILPLPFAMERDADFIVNLAHNYYFRAFGPFVEPSLLAKFLLPGFALSLSGWGKAKNNDFGMVILIFVAISCSTSVQGIVICMISFIIYIIYVKDIKWTLLKKVIGIVCFFMIIVLLMRYGILETPLDRVSSISIKDSQGDSGGMRLFRGYAVWLKLPILYKLIGIGYGNVANFVIQNNIITVFDSVFSNSVAEADYVNGMSLLLLSSGGLGLPFILKWFIYTWKNVSFTSRILIIQLILLMASGPSFISLMGVFYTYFILLGRLEEAPI